MARLTSKKSNCFGVRRELCKYSSRSPKRSGSTMGRKTSKFVCPEIAGAAATTTAIAAFPSPFAAMTIRSPCRMRLKRPLATEHSILLTPRAWSVAHIFFNVSKKIWRGAAAATAVAAGKSAAVGAAAAGAGAAGTSVAAAVRVAAEVSAAMTHKYGCGRGAGRGKCTANELLVAEGGRAAAVFVVVAPLASDFGDAAR